MSTFSHVERLPLAQVRAIDTACRRFEVAWGQSPPPRIEEYIEGATEPLRTALLRELIAVEVDLCVRRGAPLPLDALQRRFPDQTDWIANVAHDLTAPPTVPPGRLGPYRLLREVGRGGMGVVYEAVHEVLRRRVAVKVLMPSASRPAESLARFLREARIVCRLDHPHIVTVLEAGSEGDVPYFAMPFITGRNLAVVLRDRGRPMPPAEAAALAATVAETLAYAHGVGVVHRDVKPSNLLVGDDGKVWVTDFGLARSAVEATDLTAGGEMIGTLRYMPPEAFRGGWGPAGDVYGLGATLYEMLVGRAAFPGDNPYEVMESICFRPLTAPRALRPEVPAWLEALVVRTMSRDPRLRGKAGRLAHELQGPAPGRRTDRPTRRMLIVAAAGLGTLAAVTGPLQPWRRGGSTA